MVNDYATSYSINNLYSAFTPLLVLDVIMDVSIEGEMVTMNEISLNDLETMLRLIEEQRLYSIYQCYEYARLEHNDKMREIIDNPAKYADYYEYLKMKVEMVKASLEKTRDEKKSEISNKKTKKVIHLEGGRQQKVKNVGRIKHRKIGF